MNPAEKPAPFGPSASEYILDSFKPADRIAMLYEGKVLEVAHPDVSKITKNPYVRQFIEGLSRGPIQMKVKEYE